MFKYLKIPRELKQGAKSTIVPHFIYITINQLFIYFILKYIYSISNLSDAAKVTK